MNQTSSTENDARFSSRPIFQRQRAMKSTVDYYNKTAQAWADNGYGHAGDADAAPILAFASKFPAGSRFLDLCCGCGYDTDRLASLGYDAVGIDFSEESIRIARDRNPSLTFYVDNMLNDYTYIGKVDAIFVIAGLIHLETPQLRLASSACATF